MSTANISNLSIQTSMRLTIRQAQNELIKAQQEVTTGIYSDIGAEIGGATSTVVDLTRDSLRLQSIKSTNAIATQRLEASQEALDQMAKAGDEMNEALIALSGTSNTGSLQTAIQLRKSLFRCAGVCDDHIQPSSKLRKACAHALP